MRLPPLHEGILVRRYKRFLADVVLLDGQRPVVAHCPNPGSMQTCALPGGRVWLSHSADPRRKLPWTWEAAEDAAGELILIHTGRPNRIVEEALRAGLLGSGQAVQAEVRYGTEGSRVDFRLTDPRGVQPDCFVEVKSVTLQVAAGVAAFPDAVTTRGQRHLRELQGQVALGKRAVLLFLVSRSGLSAVRPADEIDPAYGQALRTAAAAGVEILARQAVFSRAADGAPVEITVGDALPVRL